MNLAAIEEIRYRRAAEEALDRALASWANYIRQSLRLEGRNLEGWEPVNILAQGPTGGAARDWSAEEDIDRCIRLMQMLHPPWAMALYARYVFLCRSANSRERRKARAAKLRQLLIQAEEPAYAKQAGVRKYNEWLALARGYVQGHHLAKLDSEEPRLL